MSLFLRMRRATEGNKTLARQVVGFFKKRDKVLASEWTTTLRPIYAQMQYEIDALIKSYDKSFWNLVNLKAINRQITEITRRFDKQFSEALVASQGKAIGFTVDQINRQFVAAGLGSPSLAFSYETVLGGVSPLTQVIVDNFAGDVAKRINAEVARSLTSGEATFSLANRLADSGISQASAERIAMTELNRAASFAQQIRGEELAKDNADLRKIWVSSHKPDSREAHLQVEEESAKAPLLIDEDFNIPLKKGGTEPALFPHDPRLSAENSVNCGCTIVYVNAGNDAAVKMVTDAIAEK